LQRLQARTRNSAEALIEIGFSRRRSEVFENLSRQRVFDLQQHGLQGRIGLYEVLEVTDEIRELILIGASALELRKKAIDDGMITLRLRDSQDQQWSHDDRGSRSRNGRLIEEKKNAKNDCNISDAPSHRGSDVALRKLSAWCAPKHRSQHASSSPLSFARLVASYRARLRRSELPLRWPIAMRFLVNLRIFRD
jgi:hypothetical protein